VNETKKERTNLIVMIGGKPAKELPVSIARDGALAKRAELKANLSLDPEFEKKLEESNKEERQLSVEKEDATRRKELANTKRKREDADLAKQNPLEIIAGFAKEEKQADRGLQRLKEGNNNLFSTESERLKLVSITVRQKNNRTIIVPIGQMVDNLEKVALESIERLSTDHSEVEDALSDTKQLEDTIIYLNVLAEKNRIPRNLRMPESDRPLRILEAEVQKSFVDASRRLEAVMKKTIAALEAKLAAVRTKPS
jgi:hypothetical protein